MQGIATVLAVRRIEPGELPTHVAGERDALAVAQHIGLGAELRNSGFANWSLVWLSPWMRCDTPIAARRALLDDGSNAHKEREAGGLGAFSVIVVEVRSRDAQRVRDGRPVARVAGTTARLFGSLFEKPSDRGHDQTWR